GKGPGCARYRMVVVRLQRRRRNRSAVRRRDRRDGADDAAVAQRGGRPAAGGRRGAGGDRRRRVLVHSAGGFSRRDLVRTDRQFKAGGIAMKRSVVVGMVLAAFALAAVKAQPPAANPNAPKTIDVDKVKDNLYVLKGGGGNTAVFIMASGVTVVDAKNPGWGQPILDKI